MVTALGREITFVLQSRPRSFSTIPTTGAVLSCPVWNRIQSGRPGFPQYHDDCMRLILLGNAGAGKSTMARKITGNASFPRLSLDQIAWDEGPKRKPLDV